MLNKFKIIPKIDFPWILFSYLDKWLWTNFHQTTNLRLQLACLTSIILKYSTLFIIMIYKYKIEDYTSHFNDKSVHPPRQVAQVNSSISCHNICNLRPRDECGYLFFARSVKAPCCKSNSPGDNLIVCLCLN